MEKHVYFVRHGETDSNAEGILRGEHAALTENGLLQAEAIATRIERIGVEALISSTYIRAIDTARAIAKHTKLEIEQNDLFIECDRPSEALGKHNSDPHVRELDKIVFDGYLRSDFRYSDEENIEDLNVRVKAALLFLEHHAASRICVVTHGRFLRAVFASMWTGGVFTGIDMQRALLTLVTSNTGVTYARLRKPEPDVEGGKAHPWRIISWNDSAHLG